MASVAVALCTFNGERYVADQLRSLARQTRLPDMVAVVDDASNDGTLEIVRDFARHAAFRITVEVNPVRLGATASFGKAIGLCEGDVIFLCDQDDVWYESKIERLAACVGEDRLLAFCDADLVNEDLSKRGHTLWDSIGLSSRERLSLSRTGQAFDLFMKRNLAWGATMAFRAASRKQLLPLPPELGHDTWIFLVLSSLGNVHAVNEPLFMYRQHSRQMYGAATAHTLSDRVSSAVKSPRRYQEMLLETWSRILGSMTEVSAIPANRVRVVEQRTKHLAARAGLSDGRFSRVAPVLRELASGRYRRFSNGLRSAAIDLLS